MSNEIPQKLKKSLIALQRYCTYRDRCSLEVRLKASKMDLTEEEISLLFDSLKEDKFIDDERYARSFVRGKFSQNRWGRIKIQHSLRQKDIPEDIITRGMEEINESEYREVITQLAKAKLKEMPRKTPLEQRAHLSRFLHNKGFEKPVIIACLDPLIKD